MKVEILTDHYGSFKLSASVRLVLFKLTQWCQRRQHNFSKVYRQRTPS